MKIQKNITQTATAFQMWMPWSRSRNNFGRLFGDGFIIWIKSQKNAVLNSATILSQAQTKASYTRKTCRNTASIFFFYQGKKVFIDVQCPEPTWNLCARLSEASCPCPRMGRGSGSGPAWMLLKAVSTGDFNLLWKLDIHIYKMQWNKRKSPDAVSKL